MAWQKSGTATLGYQHKATFISEVERKQEVLPANYVEKRDNSR